MNRECNGTFFQVGKKVYYRCFWNGVVIQYFDILKPGCPNCHRKIDPTSWKPLKPKTRTIKQAYVKGIWVDIPVGKYHETNIER